MSTYLRLFLLVCNLAACSGPIEGTPLEGGHIAATTIILLAETGVNEIPLVHNEHSMVLVEKSSHSLWLDFQYNVAVGPGAVVSIKGRAASPDTYKEVESYLKETRGTPHLVEPYGEPVLMWDGPDWKYGRTVYLLETDGDTSIVTRALLKGFI